MSTIKIRPGVKIPRLNIKSMPFQSSPISSRDTLFPRLNELIGNQVSCEFGRSNLPKDYILFQGKYIIVVEGKKVEKAKLKNELHFSKYLFGNENSIYFARFDPGSNSYVTEFKSNNSFYELLKYIKQNL